MWFGSPVAWLRGRTLSHSVGAKALIAYLALLVACDRARPVAGSSGGSLHGDSWMDVASTGFHAYWTAGGLGSCTPCHGATLDGVGEAPDRKSVV